MESSICREETMRVSLGYVIWLCSQAMCRVLYSSRVSCSTDSPAVQSHPFKDPQKRVPAVVTKFWMCKEVCNFCSNVSISLLSKFIAFNLKRFDEEIRTINEQHVSIYRIDCFNLLFERSIKNIANEIRRVNTSLQNQGEKCSLNRS